MSSETSTDASQGRASSSADQAARATAAPSAHHALPRWVRYALGGGVLVLWAVVLLGGLKAQARASTVVLFLTGAGLVWALGWLYRGLAALSVEPAAEPAAGRLGTARRRELLREKRILLKAIKELEFDRAMGKLSPQDFDEMAGRLRARAIGIMKQLDEDGSPYRAVIEKELAARVSRTPVVAPVRPAVAAPAPTPIGLCACGTQNDADARFCKSCGGKLEVA